MMMLMIILMIMMHNHDVDHNGHNQISVPHDIISSLELTLYAY